MGKTMREVFGRTLQDMKEDPKLVVLDADLARQRRRFCLKRYVRSVILMSALLNKIWSAWQLDFLPAE